MRSGGCGGAPRWSRAGAPEGVPVWPGRADPKGLRSPSASTRRAFRAALRRAPGVPAGGPAFSGLLPTPEWCVSSGAFSVGETTRTAGGGCGVSRAEPRRERGRSGGASDPRAAAGGPRERRLPPAGRGCRGRLSVGKQGPGTAGLTVRVRGWPRAPGFKDPLLGKIPAPQRPQACNWPNRGSTSDTISPWAGTRRPPSS